MPAPPESAPSEASSPWIDLAVLHDREAYARLSIPDVERLRCDVEARWPATFRDLLFLRVEEFSAGGQRHAIALYRHVPTDIEFALLPGGRFTMGGSVYSLEPDVLADLQHDVTVQPFLMARTECTQRQWQAAMGRNPSVFMHAGPDAPIENVSWLDVQDFEKKTGLLLPSEAQWEYACRAGTTTTLYTGPLTLQGGIKYWCGSCSARGPGYTDPQKGHARRDAPELDAIAWYDRNSGVSYAGGIDSLGSVGNPLDHEPAGVHPVGGKAPNAFGLHDMIGNVWEWCEDFHHFDSRSAPIDGSARREPSSSRMTRGGSWNDIADAHHSASRRKQDAGYRFADVGFRPILPLIE